MNRIRSYVVSAVVMLALDLLWLGVLAPPLYQRTIGPLLRPQPDLLAAALFYAVYLVGVNELVVRAFAPGAPLACVAARGAFFGFVAYATFDLTAQAVLRDWSWVTTAADMAWGTLLTATVAAAGFGAAGRRRA
jgi:uncharacterized membrane protein